MLERDSVVAWVRRFGAIHVLVFAFLPVGSGFQPVQAWTPSTERFPTAGFATSSDDWPSTVAEAADRLVSTLSEEDTLLVRGTAKDDLISFHRGWGMGIRNSFGLWGNNTSLLSDCGGGQVHPETCSMRIIEAVWQRLRDAMPIDKRETLEALLDSLDTISVPPYPEQHSGLPKYVAHLNNAIAEAGQGEEFLRIRCQGNKDDFRLTDFSHSHPVTVGDALAYLSYGQLVVKRVVRPPFVDLYPTPFLKEE